MREKSKWIMASLAVVCIFLPSYGKGVGQYPERLDAALSKYLIVLGARNIDQLVALDEELTSLVKEMQKTVPESEVASLWRDEYELMGVHIGHYSGIFGYSGKLLVDAHRLNPQSPYREKTLITTITGEGTSHGLGEMPDINQAELYLKEFPNGKYGPRVHRILGTFYVDLYKIIRLSQVDPVGEKDYKHECFQPYIDSTPLEQQAQRARKLAILHLQLALGSNHSENNSYLQKELEAVTNHHADSGSWFWCAD